MLSAGFVLVVAIMLVCGFLGGLASFLVNDDQKGKRTFFKHIVLGIVATMVVPLFLNMISSGLVANMADIDSGAPPLNSVLIFMAFCVLASYFARNFLETVYNKVMQKFEKLSDEIEGIKEAVEEPDLGPEELPDVKTEEPEKRLLSAFTQGKYTYRSISGLKKDSGLSDDFGETLNGLIHKDLVSSRTNRNNQPRFFLSDGGRRALGALKDSSADPPDSK